MKVLIGVRERRSTPLDEAVRAALRKEQLAQAEAHAAQQALVDALAAEMQERGKLVELTDAGQTFDIHLLTLREYVVSSKKEAVVQQQSQLEARNTALTQSRQDLRSRRDLRARNRQKIESLQTGLKAWHAQRQLEQDDQQDEESEETAVARMLSSQRAEDVAQGAP